MSYEFYNIYKSCARRMFMGDPNYFVCDIDANDVLYHTTIDGVPSTPHLSKAEVLKAIEEDPDKADREYFNKFSKGSGKNSIITMEKLLENSSTYRPVYHNGTGQQKFIFCYDPARNFDGSVLTVFEVINDPDVGYKLRIVNVHSFIDVQTKKKTPLPMPEQLRIIRQMMIDYNGDRAAEWENIEFYIDAGAGGGGISAVADELMADWTDEHGKVHKGIIDPEHKQYETSRLKYTNAYPIVHLIDPKGFKNIMYNSFERLSKLNLIEFPAYDDKDFLLVEDGDEIKQINLSEREQLTLTECNLAKNEVLYMTRIDDHNGSVRYELAADKKNKMHDDRSYCLAMGAYALALLRREDLVKEDAIAIDPKYLPSLVSDLVI